MDIEVGSNVSSVMATDTFDLSEKLTQRLGEHISDRDRIQRRIDLGTNQLQQLFKTAPKRPRDSKIVLRQKVQKLERDRTTRSLPLSQEKALIRQIDAAQKSIRQHDQCESHQEQIRRKKAEIESAREALRTTNAGISEIETALLKVELAKRLGCSTSDLITREVDCPTEKLGRVIGKNGATLKSIEESARVQIDVDKIHGKIYVRGNDSATEEAVKQLENLTLAIDEEIEVSADVVSYLLTQRSSVINGIRDNNPDVFIDVLARISRIVIRGHPEKVQKAKNDISSVRVVSKPRLLVGKEVAIVVGKTGSTINNLSDKHCVVMEVSRDGSGEDSSTLRVVGPSENVDAAIADVDSLLFQNEEVEESLVVDPMLKNRLLNNSGTGIKEFQSALNKAFADDQSDNSGGTISSGVFLVFDKASSKNDPPQLIIKCARANMDRAKRLVRRKIEEFDAGIVIVNVPPEIIPAIIGKGGSKINGLRQEGAGAEVEADAHKGIVKIHSNDAGTRESIRAAVEQIIAENQIGYVPIEKVSIGFLLGESGKEIREQIAEIGCNFGVNDDDTKIVVKGSNEQIAQASEILKNFLAQNYIAELEIEPEDEPLLFAGGASSILSKVEADLDVKVNVRKGKNLVHVRGEKLKANAAVADVQRFLNGGEGFSVCKFKVPEAAIGSVIGKGGSNISKLEADFEGVRIFIPKESNIISIRGPEDLVKQCRVRLITSVATSKVSDSIELSPQQLDDISNSDIMKRIGISTNTQISLNESSIKIRGINNDVRDAKALLTEHLTGVYRGCIDLEASQCARVKSTITKDPSHFERINLSSNAKVALEASECVIHITGKKSNVKRAKIAVMGFLDFMFPRQFQTVKVHKTLFKSIGDPSRLADIAVESGASVSLDRDLNYLLVRSDNEDDSTKAVELVKARLAECEKLNAVFRFETSDSWLLSIIIGKGGTYVQKLQTETGCAIDVFKDEVTVVISAETEEAVQEGKAALESVIEQARKECIFVSIPESAMPAFIGKGGAHIKQLAEEFEVEIERVKKNASLIKIAGEEDEVASAKEAVLSWLKKWEASHRGLTIEVDDHIIPSVLGKGGETIRKIQKETGCKIDIDRQRLAITVRDGSEDSREEALKKIKAIIEEEEAKTAERIAAKEKLRQEQVEISQSKTKPANGSKVSDNAVEQPPKEAPSDVSGVKDRSSEFASRPVGLASNKSKTKASSNAVIENGTKEGRELFLMLISGNENSSDQDDQWESSTVSSSAAMISQCSIDGENVMHYRSTSGFTVRI